MQRWQGLDDVPADQPRSVVAIGVFDGVHYGHRAVVGRAVDHAHRLGAPSVVVTFDPHPDEVVRPGTHPPLLSTIDQRCALLAELGVDAVCVLPFTRALASMSPGKSAPSSRRISGSSMSAAATGISSRRLACAKSSAHTIQPRAG